MNQSAPVERVVQILEQHGYKTLPSRLHIASVTLEFAAVLVATGKAQDLIVVVDSVQDTENRIRQKIESLGRALDLARSRRPTTAIVAGPRPSDVVTALMSRVCRVLAIGTPTGPDADKTIREHLSVLLPLSLPYGAASLADATGELHRHLPKTTDSHVKDALLEKALQGEEAVKDALRALVVEPFEQGPED
jgi:hypothetical protein